MNRRLPLIFFAILALMASSALPGADLFTPVVEAQLPGAGAQRAPAIGVDKFGSLYLTMSVATKPASAGTPGSQIFFMQSDDEGRTWNNLPLTRNLSNSNGEAFGPSMGINKVGKTRTYIVYHDNRNGDTQVYLAASKKGVKFKRPGNITPHDGGAFVPRLAMDASADAINIVWGDTLTMTRRVVFTRSTDQGFNFTELRDISRSSGEAFEPEIAIDSSDNINVIWEDTAPGNRAVMYTRSTDHGETFSEPLQISTGTGDCVEPHLAVDETGRIYVAWSETVEDGTTQLMFARSIDGGESFSEPLQISNGTSADIHKAAVVARGNQVYIAYNNDAARNRQVFVSRSSDAGESFADPTQISNADRDRGRAHSAAMCFDKQGALHIVWIDSSVIGNDEGLLFYSSSANGRNFAGQRVLLAIVQRV